MVDAKDAATSAMGIATQAINRATPAIRIVGDAACCVPFVRGCRVEEEDYACIGCVALCAHATPSELRLRREGRSKLRPLQEMSFVAFRP